jgi:hypothetical protein
MNEYDKGQVVTSAAEVNEQFFIPALLIDWPKQLLALGGVESGHHVAAIGIHKR